MNHVLVQEAGSTVLRVRGELDAVSCPELRAVLDTLSSLQKCLVTVDLSELRLIDSSGVGAMVSLYKRVRANGGEVLANRYVEHAGHRIPGRNWIIKSMALMPKNGSTIPPRP